MPRSKLPPRDCKRCIVNTAVRGSDYCHNCKSYNNRTASSMIIQHEEDTAMLAESRRKDLEKQQKVEEILKKRKADSAHGPAPASTSSSSSTSGPSPSSTSAPASSKSTSGSAPASDSNSTSPALAPMSSESTFIPMSSTVIAMPMVTAPATPIERYVEKLTRDLDSQAQEITKQKALIQEKSLELDEQRKQIELQKQELNEAREVILTERRNKNDQINGLNQEISDLNAKYDSLYDIISILARGIDFFGSNAKGSQKQNYAKTIGGDLAKMMENAKINV